MTVIERNSIVPYTSRQMYELVDNIEEYPRFLPWCHDSDVISRTDREVVAALDVTWKGMHKQLTTRNVLFPYQRIEISLVEGPMRELDGIWIFEPLGESASKVILDLKFEFGAGFLDKIFQPIFNHIANTLVDAFCKRAAELYGQT